MGDVEKLLDRSIATEGYVIKDPNSEFSRVDLSKIDFEKLREKFERGRKRMEAERLKGVLGAILDTMVKMNRTRIDYLGKFQAMIDEYNAGSVNVEEFFKKLVNFAQGLKEEEKRGLRENLTEEELALFDLLTKPDMKLTKNQELEVKKVAKELLESLKREKLVLDWRKRQQTRAMVRLCIEQVLDGLPEVFTEDLWKKKCDLAYQHIYDSYFGEGRSVYTSASA
jgi:type I restriction enzyme R subunit